MENRTTPLTRADLFRIHNDTKGREGVSAMHQTLHPATLNQLGEWSPTMALRIAENMLRRDPSGSVDWLKDRLEAPIPEEGPYHEREKLVALYMRKVIKLRSRMRNH